MKFFIDTGNLKEIEALVPLGILIALALPVLNMNLGFADAGNDVTMTSGTGTCNVHLNKAGDDNYNAATQVTESATAEKIR